jgi:hypothetical protein
MFKMLALLFVALSLAAPVFADAPAKGSKSTPVSDCGKCPKGEIREYSCKTGTGPPTNKLCKKVPGKCVSSPPPK